MPLVDRIRESTSLKAAFFHGEGSPIARTTADTFSSWRREQSGLKALVILLFFLLVATLGWALPSSVSVGEFVFTPDGRRLAGAVNGITCIPFGQAYSATKLWDVESGAQLARLPSQEGYVRSLDISPDGQTLAVASDSSTIELWDLSRLTRKGSLVGHTDDIQTLAIAPGGAELVSSGQDGFLRVWDLATQRQRLRLEDEPYGSPLHFSPDGKIVVTIGEAIHFRDIADGRIVRTIEPDERSRLIGFLSFIDQGKNILITRSIGRHGEGFHVIDGSTGSERYKVFRGRHCNPTLSPDRSLLATGNSSGVIEIQDTESGQLQLRTLPLGAAVQGMALSRDNQTLAVGLEGGKVVILDVETGAVRREISAAEPIRRFAPVAMAFGALMGAWGRLRARQEVWLA
jgi:WD40 repeat protein